MSGAKVFIDLVRQVWTVNGKAEMLQVARWGVDAIITDKTADYLALRAALESEYAQLTMFELNGRQDGTQSLTDTEASLGYLSLLYYSAFAVRFLPRT